MKLVPVTLTEARAFIDLHHSHNIPPKTWRFGVGVQDDNGTLVGVAIARTPSSRFNDDGVTLEITRSCTDGTKNVNSMLYGSIARAAKALGFRRVITFTLQTETGTALKATGWVIDRESNDTRDRWGNYTSVPLLDIFGQPRRPLEPKYRWSKTL